MSQKFSEFAVFILEFDREKFFRVDGNVALNQQFPVPSLFPEDSALPTKILLIDGVWYRQGDDFQVVYTGKDERAMVVFVYGEPKPYELAEHAQGFYGESIHDTLIKNKVIELLTSSK